MLLLAKDLGAVLILTSLAVASATSAQALDRLTAGAAVLLALNIVLVYYVPISQFDYARDRIDRLASTTRRQRGGLSNQASTSGVRQWRHDRTGLGQGYPDYIPVVETDFIFAAVGEEMGLPRRCCAGRSTSFSHSGASKLSAEQESPFLMLLGVGADHDRGCVQAAVIMAGNLALFPVTGVTLPFVSYGGCP